jgi:hypothetical protein
LKPTFTNILVKLDAEAIQDKRQIQYRQ